MKVLNDKELEKITGGAKPTWNFGMQVKLLKQGLLPGQKLGPLVKAFSGPRKAKH